MRRQTHWVGVIATVMLMAGLTGAPTAVARPTATASRPTATVASVPTLGLRQRFTEGFGHVRPRVVSYGGDPTSLVGGVRWSSWGGPRAVGHGTADWVWPGWCVACGSTQLPATVVAFGLGRCGGHPAYRHVEWYFPSRGMTFSPRLGTIDVCNPRKSPNVPQPPQAHCAPVRIPGGLVNKIQAIGYGVRCPAARRLVTHLHLLRHYRHNARFRAGAWWCGSELSMQLARVGPQSFSCQSGDENNVWFSVSRTG